MTMKDARQKRKDLKKLMPFAMPAALPVFVAGQVCRS